jgi:hypothetical protein
MQSQDLGRPQIPPTFLAGRDYGLLLLRLRVAGRWFCQGTGPWQLGADAVKGRVRGSMRSTCHVPVP